MVSLARSQGVCEVLCCSFFRVVKHALFTLTSKKAPCCLDGARVAASAKHSSPSPALVAGAKPVFEQRHAQVQPPPPSEVLERYKGKEPFGKK